MAKWLKQLRRDPIPSFLSSDSQALLYFVRRDLLSESVGSVQGLWELPEAHKIFRKQQENGSWCYPGRNREVYPETNYDLLETFRQLGFLVEEYALNRRHPQIARAAEYLFSCQTREGDIRGILGTQYMPYYHAVICELLIKAGYGEDPRIQMGLDWLLSMRQEDGGWIVPLQAVPAREKTRELWSAPPIPPDRSKPFSHLATGMVLRAFAVHPSYRTMSKVAAAAERLKSRFFQSDKYNDRKAPSYWTKLQFPFWWTNILTSLDSLSLIGFDADDGDVARALQWFVDNQGNSGLWQTSYEQANRKEMSARERDTMEWVGLAVCRVFRRLLD
jgi:hypothetical protein